MQHIGTIGVDEVGRGALAGHVMAAAVWWPTDGLPCVVGDSKKRAAPVRQQTATYLQQHTFAAVGAACVEEIDSLNILNATLLAMQRAVEAVLAALPADYTVTDILIDGNRAPTLGTSIPVRTIIKGDAQVDAIGAASILAKYTRDSYMQHVHTLHPEYGFNTHVGYGTVKHRAAIQQYGLLPCHRRSFVRGCL